MSGRLRRFEIQDLSPSISNQSRGRRQLEDGVGCYHDRGFFSLEFVLTGL